MTDHDHRSQLPGQRQQLPAADTDPVLNTPPVPLLDEEKPRPAGLREWWDDAWSDGGVLHDRWEDLRQVPELGWHGMANWLKVVIALAAGSLVVLLFNAAADTVLQALHHLLTAAPRVQVGTDTSTGIWAVIDNPVRTYLAHHSAGLPISASTVYTLWQLAGLVGLIGGLLRSTGARITWVAWGAATIAMVWTATPADARTIATGIAALAWTLAGVVALRGLSLRPTVYVHAAAPEVRNEIHPEIHVPVPPSPPADDTPDNVHPLQKR